MILLYLEVKKEDLDVNAGIFASFLLSTQEAPGLAWQKGVLLCSHPHLHLCLKTRSKTRGSEQVWSVTDLSRAKELLTSVSCSLSSDW